MSNNQEKKKEILGPSRVELLVTREYRDVVLGKAVVLIIEDKVDAAYWKSIQHISIAQHLRNQIQLEERTSRAADSARSCRRKFTSGFIQRGTGFNGRDQQSTGISN